MKNKSDMMVRKTGFEIIDLFPDPFRTTGSGRTALERLRFYDAKKKQ